MVVSISYNPYVGDENVNSRFARGDAAFFQVPGVVEDATDAEGSASWRVVEVSSSFAPIPPQTGS